MSALPRATAAIERGIEAGHHPGASLYVSLAGRAVAEVAVGVARPGVPMEPDTLLPWLSGTKVLTAVALLQQWERGEVHLDDPLRSHLPEVDAGVGPAATVRHVLTHTAGLHAADVLRETAAREPWDEAVARIAATRAPPGWVPGRRAAYSVNAGFHLLAEIVRRLDRRPFEDYVRDEVLAPLGVRDAWLALPAERRRAYGDRMGLMHDTSSPSVRPAPALDDDGAHERCVPGSSALGPVRQLARVYEMFLAGGEGVLSPQAVEAMSARHRVAMQDETLRAVVDWGLGVMCNSWYHRRAPAPYGYGDHASPRAFGHGGSQSSVAFADPEHGLVVALVCNGMPGEAVNHRRTQPVLGAIYEDLGLA